MARVNQNAATPNGVGSFMCRGRQLEQAIAPVIADVAEALTLDDGFAFSQEVHVMVATAQEQAGQGTALGKRTFARTRGRG
jgi:hypothetical protein